MTSGQHRPPSGSFAAVRPATDVSELLRGVETTVRLALSRLALPDDELERAVADITEGVRPTLERAKAMGHRE